MRNLSVEYGMRPMWEVEYSLFRRELETSDRTAKDGSNLLLNPHPKMYFLLAAMRTEGSSLHTEMFLHGSLKYGND